MKTKPRSFDYLRRAQTKLAIQFKSWMLPTPHVDDSYALVNMDEMMERPVPDIDLADDFFTVSAARTIRGDISILPLKIFAESDLAISLRQPPLTDFESDWSDESEEIWNLWISNRVWGFPVPDEEVFDVDDDAIKDLTNESEQVDFCFAVQAADFDQARKNELLYSFPTLTTPFHYLTDRMDAYKEEFQAFETESERDYCAGLLKRLWLPPLTSVSNVDDECVEEKDDQFRSPPLQTVPLNAFDGICMDAAQAHLLHFPTLSKIWFLSTDSVFPPPSKIKPTDDVAKNPRLHLQPATWIQSPESQVEIWVSPKIDVQLRPSSMIPNPTSLKRLVLPQAAMTNIDYFIAESFGLFRVNPANYISIPKVEWEITKASFDALCNKAHIYPTAQLALKLSGISFASLVSSESIHGIQAALVASYGRKKPMSLCNYLSFSFPAVIESFASHDCCMDEMWRDDPIVKMKIPKPSVSINLIKILKYYQERDVVLVSPAAKIEKNLSKSRDNEAIPKYEDANRQQASSSQLFVSSSTRQAPAVPLEIQETPVPQTLVVTSLNPPAVVVAGTKKNKNTTGGSLLSRIHALRVKIALESKKPPSLILSESAINSIVQNKPITIQALKLIKSIGSFAVQRFGTVIIKCVQDFLSDERNRMLMQTSSGGVAPVNHLPPPVEEQVEHLQQLPNQALASSTRKQTRYKRVLTSFDLEPENYATISNFLMSKGIILCQIASDLLGECSLIPNSLTAIKIIPSTLLVESDGAIEDVIEILTRICMGFEKCFLIVTLPHNTNQHPELLNDRIRQLNLSLYCLPFLVDIKYLSPAVESLCNLLHIIINNQCADLPEEVSQLEWIEDPRVHFFSGFPTMNLFTSYYLLIKCGFSIRAILMANLDWLLHITDGIISPEMIVGLYEVLHYSHNNKQ